MHAEPIPDDRAMAWHFLPADRMTRYEPRTLVEVGQTLRVDAGKLSICHYGLHASERVIDALSYAPGPILCRVELSGRILRDADKLCAAERRVIAMADATPILHEMACRAAESVLHLIPESQRAIARRAIDTKRAWLKGQASDSELAAARGAAWAAARAAARAAANAAARAAANAAAWVAARDAAWDAAWDAACDAARAAASDAARGAAWAAARAAARDAQNTQLATMACELLGVTA